MKIKLLILAAILFSAFMPTVANAVDYVSVYPSTQTDTCVKATSTATTNYSYQTTDPTKSLIGASAGQQWFTATLTNQRFHIDLGSAKVVTRVYYENSHGSGASLERGVKTFIFQGSNTDASFADTTYATDTDWDTLTCDTSQFQKHIASNIADPKYVLVTNTTAYRYYALKIADSWSSTDYMGIRRIELQITSPYATTETFTTEGAGSWIAPAGVTSVQIEAWGGGAGGGGVGVLKRSASGGGGGAYAIETAFTCVPGTTYLYVIGTKGSGGVGASDGTAGTSTTFNTTTCVAVGGTGGNQGTTGTPGGAGVAGGAAASCTGDTKYSGGASANALDYTAGSGGGSSAGTGGVGFTSGTPPAAGEAPTGGYAGGAGGSGVVPNAANNSATNYGGGGGGARGPNDSSTYNGGNGTGGRIVLSYTVGTTPYFQKKKKGIFFVK